MSDVLAPPPTLADAGESAPREDGVFEMANLTEAQTGVPGTIYVSTEEGGHGPRVKYFLKPGRSQPSYSVSIADTPTLLVSSLNEREVRRTLAKVAVFVAQNRQALLDFWHEGDGWTDPQVSAFKAALKPVS